ncbi:hypothetical protein SpiGrapes_3128 [Sphaerochaeta pleomorpha str. Grapes]|uniref:Uncharacterized protein n=1 Tax=Sphaerochaeta pleomorpha (strain ATCC BAA-1885 / DSM 22778 / Grapes) TaxID=158190 RepID=G8QZ16_SPHPG|nr:hypothetical protein [Sphaerochaeta pleomorpha]AEV30875.1 hypothetical protein SpiGrapes_3128 [Sphaerochaeta pleomorpha str. Grapes]
MKRIGSIIVFLLMESVLFATPLWNGTMLNMTIAEVSNLFPDASFEEPGEDIPGISHFEVANLLNFNIGRKMYNVYFMFIDGQLSLVQLALQNEDFLVGRDVNDIRLQLISKYGPYIDKSSDKSELNMSFDTYNWIKDGTKIQLRWNIVNGSHSVLIEYSAFEDQSLF